MPYWNYVAKHGNPDKEGLYDVILIYDQVERVDEGYTEDSFIPTGKQFAVRESRWFGPARVNDGWIMKDQPKEGLVWHEETGSYWNERVYAWYPLREYPDVELPEGVEWLEDG